MKKNKNNGRTANLLEIAERARAPRRKMGKTMCVVCREAHGNINSFRSFQSSLVEQKHCCFYLSVSLSLPLVLWSKTRVQSRRAFIWAKIEKKTRDMSWELKHCISFSFSKLNGCNWLFNTGRHTCFSFSSRSLSLCDSHENWKCQYGIFKSK